MSPTTPLRAGPSRPVSNVPALRVLTLPTTSGSRSACTPPPPRSSEAPSATSKPWLIGPPGPPRTSAACSTAPLRAVSSRLPYRSLGRLCARAHHAQVPASPSTSPRSRRARRPSHQGCNGTCLAAPGTTPLRAVSITASQQPPCTPGAHAADHFWITASLFAASAEEVSSAFGSFESWSACPPSPLGT